MITTERMNRILVDLTLDLDPKLKEGEEIQFAAKVRKEIEQAKKKKQIVEIPSEWEVDVS